MWFYFVLLSCLGVVECGFLNAKILNTGRWIVLGMEECPNPEQYSLDIKLSRRKLNRTTDAFTLKVDLPESITETSHGVFLDACKKVDGGCKQVVTLDDSSFCNFVKKYSKKNFYNLLKEVGLDDCPIPEGPIEVIDFVLNYEDLPDEGLVGEFIATFYVLKDGARVACFRGDLLFDEIDD